MRITEKSAIFPSDIENLCTIGLKARQKVSLGSRFVEGIGSEMSLLCLCKCLHPLGKIESVVTCTERIYICIEKMYIVGERKAVSNMLRRYFRVGLSTISSLLSFYVALFGGALSTRKCFAF